MSNMFGEIQEKVTDEERRRHRDSLSPEERRELSQKVSYRTMQQLFSGGTDDMSRIEARLERIEKRLDELALKQ